MFDTGRNSWLQPEKQEQVGAFITGSVRWLGVEVEPFICDDLQMNSYENVRL